MAKIAPVNCPWWTRMRVLTALAFAAGVVLTVIMWSYCSSGKPREDKLDFSVKVAFGSAAVMSLLVAFQALKHNIYREQVKGTYEFLARYNSEAERKNRKKIRAAFKLTGKFEKLRDEEISELRIQGFIQTLGTDGEEAAASLMSLFEDLALAVRSGYVNESTTFRSLGPVAVEYIQGLRPYVFHIQRDRGNKVYFEDALLLLNHWRNGDSFRGEVRK